MWAATEIAVDGRDQSDVQLMLQPGTTVAGRIVTDTGAEAAYSRMSLGLTPIGAQKNELGVVGPAAVDAAGRFTIRGVLARPVSAYRDGRHARWPFAVIRGVWRPGHS